MTFPRNLFDYSLSQHVPQALRAGRACADEPDPARRQTFDGGDADFLFEATGDCLAFVDVEEHRAAHGFEPRFAAASASLALE